MKIHYEVETRFIYGWENTWHDDDEWAEDLLTFETYEEARKDLDEHLSTQTEIGSLQGDPADYRIVKVTRQVAYL